MLKVLSAAVLAAGMVAAPAVAADYTYVRVDTVVNAPIDKAWGIIGPFCSIAVWSPDHAPCKLEGDGGPGSMRIIPPGDLHELMAAQTKYSYTYIQPNKDLIYHGTMAAEPVDKKHTRMIYIAMYDQEPLGTAEAKAADRKRRIDRWTFQMTRIKALIESTK